MAKTIFILVDGCGDGLAKRCLGYLEHLVENGRLLRFTVQGQLPTLSRPLYETLLTGLPACVHGITSNYTCRASSCESVFSLCRAAGLTTAAAAYHWVSQLYGAGPFCPERDRIQLGGSGTIQNGIYYFEDDYPDSHVLCDAEHLRRSCRPDFLMIHTMNIDDAGHKHGGSGKETAFCALKLDTALAGLIPAWLDDGYELLITSDHGMDEDGLHGGNTDALRRLPLYVSSGRVSHHGNGADRLPQLAVAPLLCGLLGIKGASRMMTLQEIGVTVHAD